VRKYEILFIIRPLEEEATNAIIDKFSKLIAANGGQIEKEDRWGKKRLAYEIKKESEGYYVLFYTNCEPNCINECDRVMKITDEILKHMIVRSDQ
jgi:small subunit ribosomal protein S6